MSDQILVKSSWPPVVELDTTSCAAYVRFQTAAVARTVSPRKHGPVVAIDYDANGEVIGVELVGVKEFGIAALLRVAAVQAPNVDVSKARYVGAGVKIGEPAFA